MKKTVIASLCLSMIFFLLAPVSFAQKSKSLWRGNFKYLELKHFGIRPVKKIKYSKNKIGKTVSGKVVDPEKASFADVFKNSSKGNKVQITYLENAEVKVVNLATRETAIIQIRETIP